MIYMEYNLERFVVADERDYANALAEIRAGEKRTHWMWYIFPQLAGLGHSSTAQYYAIKNLREAAAYLEHPVLGRHLSEISAALLCISHNNAGTIFGLPDDLKLRSCMTLFGFIPGADPVFTRVLEKFFSGRFDNKTVALLLFPDS